VTGGEPTSHPELLEILDLLMMSFPKTQLKVGTNGVNKDVIGRIPSSVYVHNTGKIAGVCCHLPINKAPIDFGLIVDLSDDQCFAVPVCSIALSKFGYYFSGPCAGIDRVFGFDVGVKSLREVVESDFVLLERQQNLLCQYCGLGIKGERASSDQVISPTWKIALESWSRRKSE